MFRRIVRRPSQKQRQQTANSSNRIGMRRSKKSNKQLSDVFNHPKVMNNIFFTSPTEEEAEEITRILEAKNHFEVLEMNHEDDLDEEEDLLRSSYMRKCLLLNPNTCNHPRLEEAYKKLATAYDTLCDPHERQEHIYEKFGGRPDPLMSLLGGLFNEPGLFENNARQQIIRRPMQQDPFDSLISQFFGEVLQPPRRREEAVERNDQRARRRTRVQRADDSDDEDFDIFDTVFRSFAGLTSSEAPSQRAQPTTRPQQPRRLRIVRREPQAQPARTPVVVRQQPMPSLLDAIFGNHQPQQNNSVVRLIGPGGLSINFGNNGGPRTRVANPTQRPRRSAGGERYAAELEQLRSMGFDNLGRARRALEATNGNVPEAINLLLM